MDSKNTEMTVEEELAMALEQNARLVAEIQTLNRDLNMERVKSHALGASLVDTKEAILMAAELSGVDERKTKMLRAELELTKMIMADD